MNLMKQSEMMAKRNTKKSSQKKQSKEFPSILKANRGLKLNLGGGEYGGDKSENGYGSSNVRGGRTIGVNRGGVRGGTKSSYG